MTITTIFFDLDETLYPYGTNSPLKLVNQRIDELVKEMFQMPIDQVRTFRHAMFEKYGATTTGLALEYGVDLCKFIHDAHAIDVDSVVKPNPELRAILDQIQASKVIFTSAYRFYAVKVLKRIGILDCFDGIVDIIDVYPTGKPHIEAFKKVMRISGVDNPQECAFFDDQPKNVIAGHSAGLFSVMVGNKAPVPAEADASIDRIEMILSIPKIREILQ